MGVRRPTGASATDPAAAPARRDTGGGAAGSDDSSMSMDIDVISKRLDVARQQIQPSLGATTYTFTPEDLTNIPQGENAPLNQVLLQAPGVAQDSFGQIHLRGEHANVQYRLNGVELPEGLSVFGQAIENRFAQSLSLITGTLPAQYGFRRPPAWWTSRPRAASAIRGSRRRCTAAVGTGWSRAWTTADIAGRWIILITVDGLHNDRGIEEPDLELRGDP